MDINLGVKLCNLPHFFHQFIAMCKPYLWRSGRDQGFHDMFWHPLINRKLHTISCVFCFTDSSLSIGTK